GESTTQAIVAARQMSSTVLDLVRQSLSPDCKRLNTSEPYAQQRGGLGAKLMRCKGSGDDIKAALVGVRDSLEEQRIPSFIFQRELLMVLHSDAMSTHFQGRGTNHVGHGVLGVSSRLEKEFEVGGAGMPGPVPRTRSRAGEQDGTENCSLLFELWQLHESGLLPLSRVLEADETLPMGLRSPGNLQGIFSHVLVHQMRDLVSPFPAFPPFPREPSPSLAQSQHFQSTCRGKAPVA
ncbi:unnamed protein product, partial [Discosporangium mesarthrocarpum]